MYSCEVNSYHSFFVQGFSKRKIFLNDSKEGYLKEAREAPPPLGMGGQYTHVSFTPVGFCGYNDEHLCTKTSQRTK